MRGQGEKGTLKKGKKNLWANKTLTKKEGASSEKEGSSREEPEKSELQRRKTPSVLLQRPHEGPAEAGSDLKHLFDTPTTRNKMFQAERSRKDHF